MSAVDLLAVEVARRGGNKAAVGRRCGISRTAVSLLLAGKYPADTARIEMTIVNALKRHECPWTGDWMHDAECQARADAPPPSSSPAAYKHWQACQSCLSRQHKETTS